MHEQYKWENYELLYFIWLKSQEIRKMFLGVDIIKDRSMFKNTIGYSKFIETSSDKKVGI